MSSYKQPTFDIGTLRVDNVGTSGFDQLGKAFRNINEEQARLAKQKEDDRRWALTNARAEEGMQLRREAAQAAKDKLAKENMQEDAAQDLSGRLATALPAYALASNQADRTAINTKATNAWDAVLKSKPELEAEYNKAKKYGSYDDLQAVREKIMGTVVGAGGSKLSDVISSAYKAYRPYKEEVAGSVGLAGRGMDVSRKDFGDILKNIREGTASEADLKEAYQDEAQQAFDNKIKAANAESSRIRALKAATKKGNRYKSDGYIKPGELARAKGNLIASVDKFEGSWSIPGDVDATDVGDAIDRAPIDGKKGGKTLAQYAEDRGLPSGVVYDLASDAVAAVTVNGFFDVGADRDELMTKTKELIDKYSKGRDSYIAGKSLHRGSKIGAITQPTSAGDLKTLRRRRIMQGLEDVTKAFTPQDDSVTVNPPAGNRPTGKGQGTKPAGSGVENGITKVDLAAMAKEFSSLGGSSVSAEDVQEAIGNSNNAEFGNVEAAINGNENKVATAGSAGTTNTVLDGLGTEESSSLKYPDRPYNPRTNPKVGNVKGIDTSRVEELARWLSSPTANPVLKKVARDVGAAGNEFLTDLFTVSGEGSRITKPKISVAPTKIPEWASVGKLSKALGSVPGSREAASLGVNTYDWAEHNIRPEDNPNVTQLFNEEQAPYQKWKPRSIKFPDTPKDEADVQGLMGFVGSNKGLAEQMLKDALGSTDRNYQNNLIQALTKEHPELVKKYMSNLFDVDTAANAKGMRDTALQMVEDSKGTGKELSYFEAIQILDNAYRQKYR